MCGPNLLFAIPQRKLGWLTSEIHHLSVWSIMADYKVLSDFSPLLYWKLLEGLDGVCWWPLLMVSETGSRETGDICWVPKRTGVSWELAGSKGVEWWSGRVTAKGSHSLVATVRSSPWRITSGSGVSMTWDREVLGLSEIASKASAVIKVSSLYWRVEVLEIEGDVMTRAAGNTDLPASPTRIGGWVVVLVDGTDILTE